MATTGTLTANETINTLDWVIDGFENSFPEHFPGPSNRIRSPLAEVQHLSGAGPTSSWWELSVALCVGRYDLYLTWKDAQPGDGLRRSIRCKYTIHLGSEGQPTLHARGRGVKIFTKTEREHWTVLVLMGPLCTRRAQLLQGGTLRMRVTLEIEDTPCTKTATTTTTSTLTEPLIPPPHPVWEALFNDKTFTDVTFRISGSEEIQAHKIVLACSSPVLRQMLTTDTVEAATGVVQLDDLDSDALNFILRYIYTGRVSELDPDIALSVIHGAEKYGMDELKDYCFSKLIECITDESVGPLAVVANFYRAQPGVIKVIQDYVHENFFSRIRESPGLRQLVKHHPDAFF